MSDNQSNKQVSHHDDNTPGGLICLTFTMGALLILIGIGVTSIPMFQAKNITCGVSNVTYPTEINSNSYDPNNPDFITCDCGRNCMSDLGYCIRVFVYHENFTKMAYDSVTYNPFINCSIAETKCINGESIADRTRALNESAERALPYVEIMENNSTFPCYELNGNIFIENPINNMIVTLSIVGGLSFMFLVSTIILCRQ